MHGGGESGPEKLGTLLNSSPELGQNLNHLGTGLGHGLLPEHCKKSHSRPHNVMRKQEALQHDFNYFPLSEQGCNSAGKALPLLLYVITHQLLRGSWKMGKQSQLQQ